MRRFMAAMAVAAAAWAWCGSSPAEAGMTISPNNPYRSFSISGYNYGSMQWERAHGNSGYSGRTYSRGGGGWFSRRR